MLTLKSRHLRNPLLLVLICFLLLISASVPDSAAETDNTFDVGLVLPLTGNSADYGIAIQNSIALAVKDRPELFKNIRFYYQDAMSDPKQAISAFTQLVDIEKVDLAVTWGVSFCKVLAPIAESHKVPLVGICLDPDAGAGRKYVLRFLNVTDEYMDVQAAYLANLGVKKIALLLTENPYLEEMVEALRRKLRPGQTIEIVERLPATEMDFRTRILKLQKQDYDAVGVYLWFGQIATFYKQATQLGFKKTAFGTNLFESSSEVAASGGAMEGAVFANTAIHPEFLKHYRTEYGNESQLAFGAPAYEFAITVGELFNEVNGRVARDEIISRFNQVSAREGTASGPFHFVSDSKFGQYMRFPLTMKQVRGDSFVDIPVK